MQLNIRAFALACGLLWGFGLFLMTWWIVLFDGPSADPTLLARVYRGYELTPFGSIVGLVWGLVDGAIGGAILAWLYNTLSVANPSSPNRTFFWRGHFIRDKIGKLKSAANVSADFKKLQVLMWMRFGSVLTCI